MSAPELMRLVYRNKKTPALSANDIPTLIPEASMNALLNGDDNPYYKVEAIDYPATGTGGIYEGDFFKSFINKLKDNPFPGSKRGHENASRPSSDFYTVGGKVVPKDENSGTAYLKMYIPKDGDTTSNSGLIRDAKAGIVNFSLVTWPEYNTVDDGKGNMTRHFTASKGYERNDAVELGAGAMDQTVNSALNNAQSVQTLTASVTNATSLINSGKVDKTSGWSFKKPDEDKLLGSSGDDWTTYAKWHLAEDTSKTEKTKDRYKYPYGKDGKVYRSALRAIASRAAAHGLSDLSDTASNLLKLMDKSKSGGRNNMDEELETIKNGLDNGAININAVADKLGIKNKLRTEADEKNSATVTELAKQFNCKPEELTATLVSIKNAQDAANKATVENAVIKAFGAATVKNGKGEDVKNLAYTRAMTLCNGKTGAELDTAIKNAADDDYIKAFRSQMADVNSEINVIETNGTKPDELNQNGAFML